VLLLCGEVMGTSTGYLGAQSARVLSRGSWLACVQELACERSLLDGEVCHDGNGVIGEAHAGNSLLVLRASVLAAAS
jgi:hypothetical protein